MANHRAKRAPIFSSPVPFQSTAGHTRSLVDRFEGVKPKPAPAPVLERFTSAVDGPRAVVSGEAASARDDAAARVGDRLAKRASEAMGDRASLPGGGRALGGAKRRMPPPIVARDSDRVCELKREVVAREAEIQAMAAKLAELAGKLERLADVFTTAQVGIASPASQGVFEPPKISGESFYGPVPKAPTSASAATLTPKPKARRAATSAVVAKSSGIAPAISSPSSVSGAVGSSLEEILAAARGGRQGAGAGTRITSEKPKYSSLLK